MINDFIFPFPLPFHIIISIVSVVFFLIQYSRKKYVYLLLLVFAIPSTLLVYFCRDKLTFTLLGIEEFVMLALIFVYIAKAKKQTEKRTEKVSEVSDENSNNRQENTDE